MSDDDRDDRHGRHERGGRSTARTLTLILNGTVAAADIAAGAFALTNNRGPVDIAVQSVVNDGDRTRITLAFDRSSNGHYALTVDGSKIKDALGQAADMDGDGFAGGVRRLSFHVNHRDRN